jgi:two-component system response regulator NreC
MDLSHRNRHISILSSSYSAYSKGLHQTYSLAPVLLHHVTVRSTPLRKARIIVADDSPAFLQILASLLALEFDVLATAADGQTALHLSSFHKPDVVVLDLEMPGLNGIEVTRELVKHSPAVVICSALTDPEIVEALRLAGAQAYVSKMRVARDLITAVKSVLEGKSFVSPGLC